MQKIREYLTNPTTRIGFWVFLVWIWVTRWSLNTRIDTIEKKYDEMDLVKIQTTLSQIQTDIEWIKKSLVK